MWIRGIGAMVTFVGSSLCADKTGGQMERSVTVCMQGGHPLVMGYARKLVSQVFAAIDVEIDWRWRQCPADAIRISLQTRTSLRERPGALAYTMPYEGKHIMVFYDRVLEQVEAGRVPALMGHVIAHEIAHILEGVKRHSATGIMKERWTADDYLQMAWKPLPFAPEDIILIHRGLAGRPAQAAKAP